MSITFPGCTATMQREMKLHVCFWFQSACVFSSLRCSYEKIWKAKNLWWKHRKWIFTSLDVFWNRQDSFCCVCEWEWLFVGLLWFDTVLQENTTAIIRNISMSGFSFVGLLWVCSFLKFGCLAAAGSPTVCVFLWFFLWGSHLLLNHYFSCLWTVFSSTFSYISIFQIKFTGF